MTYFIDQESFSSVYDETHSPIINDLDEMFDDIVMKLAEYDCLNYWNGREVAFTHDGDSVALNGMTETTRALLQAIGERDGRGYRSALELYVHAWECVQADFVELGDEE